MKKGFPTKHKFYKWNFLALACALAIGSCALPARAADDNVKIGVLDEIRLGEGFTAYRTAMQDLANHGKGQEDLLDAREVLNPTEAKRFDELFKNDKRSAAEETEFKNLTKAGNDRRADLSTLVAKAARTADEEKHMAQIQEYRKANAIDVRKMEDDMFQDYKAREEATDKQFIDKANLMVQKVAGDKKLTVVLRKTAIVWFTPTIDITDEVLKRLNTQ